MDMHAQRSRTQAARSSVGGRRLRQRLHRAWIAAALGLFTAWPALADGLAPGEFEWSPDVSPQGPMVIVVSLPQQRAHVYRNGVRIGLSTISSGKPGHETPTGVFTILQKKKMHYSNLYNNAPMPFMQRLTWDGVALHAGRIPGHPASHGCVRLPLQFAELLFGVTERDMTVVIADESSHGPGVVHAGERVPVNYVTGEPLRSEGEPVAYQRAVAEY